MRILLALCLVGFLAALVWFLGIPHAQPEPLPSPRPVPLQPAPPPADPTPPLSAAAKRILAAEGDSPATKDLLLLTDEDIPGLRKAYRTSDDLAGKRALTWALAYCGDRDAVPFLIQTLEGDFGGKTLSRAEEQVLGETLLGLGLLASESDPALAYLKKATDPAYWKSLEGWQSRLGAWGKVQFVLPAIQGVGLACRSDVDQTLAAFRERDPDYLYHFGTSVSEAAFQAWWIQNRGRDSVMQHMREETRLTFYAAWANGPGKEWVGWANGLRRGRKAPPLP